MRKWRNAVVTAAWVAVGTAAGALGAWQLASADGGGDAAHSRPLDEAAVRRALAGAAHSPPARRKTPPPAPPSHSSSPSAERSTVRFTGGSATVECRPDGTVRLVSWSPADGFHIDDDVERGPAPVVRLEAEPADDDAQEDLPYELRCTATGPRAKVVPDTDEED
ncbi:hypothetical protein AB0H82_02460 [Streptomyces sp. NPDC050732]|uniref:hypothetical protein n=1 Tax=Streptomyces sp. NPDC050732 TaxID=3154632 RepID=UPI00342519B7